MVIESLCHFSRSDWVILVWANDWRGSFWGRDPVWVRLLARSSFCTFGTTDRPLLLSSSLSSSSAFFFPWGLRKGLCLRVTMDTSAEVEAESESLWWRAATEGNTKNSVNTTTDMEGQRRRRRCAKGIFNKLGMFPPRSWNLLRKLWALKLSWKKSTHFLVNFLFSISTAIPR